jgi:glycine/D-amino acid oxidase-like deaminating enzyme
MDDLGHVDIAIVGGGIAGVSLAFFLGNACSVALLEKEDQLGYHATGRSAAEFVLNYNAPEIRALARIAKPFFDAPPQGFADVPLLVPRGGLVVADAERAEMLASQYAALKPDHPGLLRLTAEEAVARAPFLDPAAIADAYYDPEYWDIEVDALMQGYLRAARKAGHRILTRAGLRSASHDGTRWTLETEAGRLTADILVNAAGGWADPVAALAGVRPLGVTPMRRTAILADLPEGMDAATLPEINAVDDRFYFKPDGGRLLVSPADETPCEPGDVQPEEIDVAWAVHHLEENTTLRIRRVGTAWAGMRSFTPDRLPAVGFAPDHPAFFWLAGQGGYGILTSPALGQLAASLLTRQPLPSRFAGEGLDANTFDPGRF